MTVRTSVAFIVSKLVLHIFTSFLQDWMAFTKLKTDNFSLTDSLVFTNNNSPPNKQDNNAICQVVPFDSCFKACLKKFLGFNFKYKHFSHLHLVSSFLSTLDSILLVKLYSPYFVLFLWLLARALVCQLLIMSMHVLSETVN